MSVYDWLTHCATLIVGRINAEAFNQKTWVMQ